MESAQGRHESERGRKMRENNEGTERSSRGEQSPSAVELNTHHELIHKILPLLKGKMIGLEKPRLTAGRVQVPDPVPPPDAAASVGPPCRHIIRINGVVSLEHKRGVVEGLGSERGQRGSGERKRVSL